MKTYEATSINVNNAFPLCVAKNSSGPATTDGTPWVQDYVNDEWGFWQALMARAGGTGITPSGTVELYVAGAPVFSTPSMQKMYAMQRTFGMPGDLVFTMLNPTALALRRIILLTGQPISASLYPDLCNNVYCGDANNATAPCFYYTSDAGGTTRSTTNKNYIVMPDARGVTIRNTDSSNSRDPSGSTRLLGSVQGHMFQGHGHDKLRYSGSDYSDGGAIAPGAGSGVVPYPSAGVNKWSFIGIITDGINGTPQAGPETRMVNMQCQIGIIY